MSSPFFKEPLSESDKGFLLYNSFKKRVYLI